MRQAVPRLHRPAPLSRLADRQVSLRPLLTLAHCRRPVARKQLWCSGQGRAARSSCGKSTPAGGGAVGWVRGVPAMADHIQVTLDDPKTVEFLRSKVRSGEFASEDDAVRKMVAAWREEDAAFEKWLKVEIRRRHDEAVAHPERQMAIEEVERRLGIARKNREALVSEMRVN